MQLRWGSSTIPTTTKFKRNLLLLLLQVVLLPTTAKFKLKLLLLLFQVVLLPTTAKFKTEAFTVVVAGGAVAHNSKV
jgi:hypothetical protein